MGNHEIGCLNHCPGGGSHGGGSWVAGLILLAIVIIGAAGYKVRRGIGTGLHIFGDVLQGIMWTILGLAVIGLVAGGIWAGRRVHAAIRSRRQAVFPAAELPAWTDPSKRSSARGTGNHQQIPARVLAIGGVRVPGDGDERYGLSDRYGPDRSYSRDDRHVAHVDDVLIQPAPPAGGPAQAPPPPDPVMAGSLPRDSHGAVRWPRPGNTQR